MRKKEQLLWDAMKRNRPKRLWLSRIENVATDGMPDVFCVFRGQQLWVELKSPRRPKRPTTRFLGDEGLRRSQINWHLRAAANGVRSYVLIRDDHKDIFLVPCRHAAEINDAPLDKIRDWSVAATWHNVFLELTS